MNKKVFYTILLILLTFIGVSSFLLVRQYAFNQKNINNGEKAIVSEHSVCKKSPSDINIVMITDTRYVSPTMVAMYSAIKNKCENSFYHFYIVTEGISKNDEQQLLSLKNLGYDGVEIEIIKQNEPDLPFENMKRFLRYKVGMHKIFLPQILPQIEKVIYMDGDTLVLKDLNELYDIDVNGIYAAVAKDAIYYRFHREMVQMGLDKRGFYFNSE